MNLDGRTVLLTGAGRGIGADTARRLHARGANLALVDRDPDGVEALAAALGDRAAALPADVTDRDALQRVVSETRTRFGALDVVIANAGIAPPHVTIRTIDQAAFERTIEVDLLGVWRTVRAGLPDVVSNGGHVLVVASIYAFFNGVLNASYAASKAGVEQLGRALRVELAPHGATAGVAYFGFIDTDMVRDAFAQPAIEAFRGALPAWLTRPVPVGDAAEAMVRGVERRSPVVAVPRWVPIALRARPLLTALDGRLARDPKIAEAVRIAESERLSVAPRVAGPHSDRP